MKGKILRENIAPGADAFEGIIEQLNNFSSHSEDHFIEIGQKLQQYHSTSGQILNDALEVTNLLCSQQYRSDIDNLKNVSDDSFSYLSKSENKFLTSSKIFSETKTLLGIIDTDVFEFRKLVKQLEVQAIAVKIESSRLGNDDKGFGNLALNINALANLISSQFLGFREKSKILNGVITGAHKQIESLRINQKEYSAEIIEGTKTSINSLIEKYELSTVKADAIHKGTKNIHTEISSMVTALQFHDITRQQIESVTHVLKELIDKINEVKNSDVDTDEQEIISYIQKIATLQSAQLKNSKSELNNALHEITSNLETISTSISTISSEITNLIENTGSGDNSFIEKVITTLNNSIVTLLKNLNLENELSHSVETVVNTIGELTAFINEISGIGSEIELISLNARIKAAHTGKEGAALAVLAEAIQKLSIEAKAHTGSVIEKLESVKTMSSRLYDSNNINVINKDEEKLKLVSTEINKINDCLGSTVESATKELNKIHKSVMNLEKDIELSINANKYYQAIDITLGEIINQLDEIVLRNGKFVDKSVIEDIKLSEINNKYTMKVQRDIHNSILNADEILSGDDGLKRNSGSGEFGDNVELF